MNGAHRFRHFGLPRLRIETWCTRGSHAEDGEGGVADHGVGEVAEAAVGSGAGAAADDEHVGAGLVGGLEQCVLDGADGDAGGGIGSHGLEQLLQALGGQVFFGGVEFCFKMQFDGEFGVLALHGVKEGEVGVRFAGGAGGETEDAFGIAGQTDGADPLAMFDGVGCMGFGMPAGENGAVGIVEDFGGGGAEEGLAKDAGVGGHDNEVELAIAGGFGDLCGGIAGDEDAGRSGVGELLCEKGIEAFASDGVVLFGDFRSGPEVELESVVAFEVDDVHEGDLGVGKDGCAFYVSCHGDAGGREVHRKEDVLNQRHGSPP